MANRLKITDDFSGFTIEYSWFTPIAYFMLAFCIFWNGTLFFWYGDTLIWKRNSDISTLLVPVVHLAAGLYLAYYTACTFLNSTFVRIEDSYLRIDHSPLPWWRGKKDIPVRKIEQLYVKEKQQGEGGISYQLYVKIVNGSTRPLITTPNIDADTALRLERVLEEKLGIVDQPIKGEFDNDKPRVSGPASPRQSTIFTTTNQVALQQLRVGDLVDYARTTYEIIYVTQYNWWNEDTEKLLQLYSATGQEQLVYLHLDTAAYMPWRERKLEPDEQNRLAFDPEAPADTLVYDHVTYRLTELRSGTAFRRTDAPGLAAAQWLYRSADEQRQLRILSLDGAMDTYVGERENSTAFENLLTS